MMAQKWRDYNENLQKLRDVFKNETSLIIFDCETTGLSTKKDKIIQLAGIRYNIVDEKLEEAEYLNVYINPEVPLHSKITEITGITDEMLRDKPNENEAFVNSVLPFFGTKANLSGHNVHRFDIPLLTNLYERQGKTLIVNKEIDTLNIAKDLAAREGVSNSKLQTLCEHFGLDVGLSFHDAYDDVRATARLLQFGYLKYLEYEKEEENKKADLKTPQISGVSFWPGFRGHSRVYIKTNYGEFYYDTFNKRYGKQDESMYRLYEFNMEKFRKNLWDFLNIDSDDKLVAAAKKGHA